MSIRNKILVKIVEAHPYTVTNPNNRNSLLVDCVDAVGGVIRDRHNRNMLLEDYLFAISGGNDFNQVDFLPGDFV